MTKVDAMMMKKELCKIFDTSLCGGVENIAFLMSSLTCHDLNLKFGAAKEMLRKFSPDFKFDFSEKVFDAMRERIYKSGKVGKNAYSLYEVVYGFILLLDCFLEIDRLGEDE